MLLLCLGFAVAVSGAVSEGATTRPLIQRDNGFPAWSPDGRQIAYERGSGDHVPYEIHTINVDGTHQRKLTYFGSNINPAWSPDGHKIAFTCDPGGGLRICVMNVDGSARKQLTNGSTISDDMYPVWSPDGRRIAFESSRMPAAGIYVMDADGTHQRRVAADGTYPNWSPDGRKIAFLCLGGELCVVNAEGGGRRLLAEHLFGTGLVLSPDWRKVAFVRGAGSSPYEIYVANLDGTHERRLTYNPPTGDATPAWSPDGSKIAFESSRDPGHQFNAIYVMNADGTKQTRVTP
jgi:TolB protein